jgi:hypothetical protein
MPDDLSEAARMAGVAALTGGAARVLVALHGGVRRWQVLLLEAGLGAMLGIMAAGAAVWWDPSLRDIGWPLLIVASAAGCAGAVGTRVMDVVVAAVERKVG